MDTTKTTTAGDATEPPGDVSRGPASAVERQFWIGERMAPGAVAHRVLAPIRLEGPVRHDALTAAVTAVCTRHEALRTAFLPRDGELVRVVRGATGGPLLLPPGTAHHEVRAALLTPDAFDLAAGRLHRTAIVPDHGGTGATVHLAVHHIVFDGLSHGIVTADLADAYRALVDGGAPDTEPVRRAQPPRLDDARRAELAAHWHRTLHDVPELPCDGAAPTQRDLAGAPLKESVRRWPATGTEAVRTAARAQACSPFAVLLAAYGQALAELSGAADFCVGTPVALRSAAQEREVGCLIGMLPVRLADWRAPGVVPAVWDAVTSGVLHADLPLGDIVRAARTAPSRRPPLYQAVFAFQSWHGARHTAGPVTVQAVPARPLGSQTDIQFNVAELPDGRLEAVAQAPETSPWADRVARLTGSFARSLGRLAAGFATPATQPGDGGV